MALRSPACAPPKKEPVLLSEGRGAEGIFHGIVVDLDAPIAEIDAQRGPLAERVCDGLAHGALGEVAVALVPAPQGGAESFEDGSAFEAAREGAQLWPGAPGAQPRSRAKAP